MKRILARLAALACVGLIQPWATPILQHRLNLAAVKSKSRPGVPVGLI
jgi:hypothetical protein